MGHQHLHGCSGSGSVIHRHLGYTICIYIASTDGGGRRDGNGRTRFNQFCVLFTIFVCYNLAPLYENSIGRVILRRNSIFNGIQIHHQSHCIHSSHPHRIIIFFDLRIFIRSSLTRRTQTNTHGLSPAGGGVCRYVCIFSILAKQFRLNGFDALYVILCVMSHVYICRVYSSIYLSVCLSGARSHSLARSLSEPVCVLFMESIRMSSISLFIETNRYL